MTVADLIALLVTHPPLAPVYVSGILWPVIPAETVGPVEPDPYPITGEQLPPGILIR